MNNILQDLSPARVAQALDANKIAFGTLLSTLPHAAFYAELGLRWFETGVPDELFNGVWSAPMSGVPSAVSKSRPHFKDVVHIQVQLAYQILIPKSSYLILSLPNSNQSLVIFYCEQYFSKLLPIREGSAIVNDIIGVSTYAYSERICIAWVSGVDIEFVADYSSIGEGRAASVRTFSIMVEVRRSNSLNCPIIRMNK